MSTRELASAIWLLVLVGFGVSHKSIRQSALQVMRAFLAPKVAAVMGCMLLYTVMAVLLLRVVGFWRAPLLKDTVLWFCFGATALMVSIMTEKSHESVLRHVLSQSLKVMILVQYLANTYTFSFGVELLMQPVLAVIVLTAAVAEADPDHAEVARVMSGLQTLIGLAILAYVSWTAVTDYITLLSTETIRSVLLAPVLSILLVPFLYAVLRYSEYDQRRAIRRLG